MFSAAEEKSFIQWMRSNNQIYTSDEYNLRLGLWMQNARIVQEHNRKNLGFTLSMNGLSALTPAEYRSMLSFRPISTVRKTLPKKNNANDVVIDWRDKGCVNAIKNQGSCGSCWAFSTTQAAEGQYAAIRGTLYSFSEQNLVDCVTKDYDCEGCDGGLMEGAYNYVIDKQGGQFMLESDYGYKGTAGTCKWDASKAVGKITGITTITEGDEADLADKCLNYGPIAIAIDASHISFQLYNKGIYDEKRCSPDNLDHGVGCIGYGTENDVNYWIVRNSWGTSWGEKGYIRMVKDKNNQCGEASMACFPTV
jgi:cathepsin L